VQTHSRVGQCEQWATFHVIKMLLLSETHILAFFLVARIQRRQRADMVFPMVKSLTIETFSIVQSTYASCGIGHNRLLAEHVD